MMEQHSTAIPATSRRGIPKKIRALKILLQRSLIQPEAHQLYGETALHSVISQLSNDHGLTFDRKSEPYGVYKARFTRYTLAEASKQQAIKLVEFYENRGQA